jgi:hypothetical protein
MPAKTLSSGTACNGTFGGKFDGDIEVSTGQSCSFIAPCEITGNVKVDGGTFTLTGCTVDGDVKGKAGKITLEQNAAVKHDVGGSENISFSLAGSAIGGDLEIKHLDSGIGQGVVCGMQIRGGLKARGNRSPLAVGRNNTKTCAGNTIGYDLLADWNRAAMTVDGNKIGGSMEVIGNTGGIDVSGNKIGEDLVCSDNHPSPTHISLNIVDGNGEDGDDNDDNRGQCAVFP